MASCSGTPISIGPLSLSAIAALVSAIRSANLRASLSKSVETYEVRQTDEEVSVMKPSFRQVDCTLAHLKEILRRGFANPIRTRVDSAIAVLRHTQVSPGGSSGFRGMEKEAIPAELT
jgi:hypothetical protein